LVDRSSINDDDWKKLLTKTKKRMGPATHVGLNRALLDFSNRLVPYITEQRFCGKVIYSGGDDVMAALPLADLPEFLISLRAAWCGANDPHGQFTSEGGYWEWEGQPPLEIPRRPLFTMGEGATMSLGIVIAHKSVPLPTVLENIWEAEKERAKKLIGDKNKNIPNKDGLCFRVIYSSGNTLEALMKGHLLEPWWKFVQTWSGEPDISSLLHKLAEEISHRASVTEGYKLFKLIAEVVINSRSQPIMSEVKNALLNWFDAWEEWAWAASQNALRWDEKALGTTPEDMSMLLRFSAFWISQRRQEKSWGDKLDD
jgi:CRISPR-associated protein Cmr2